MLSRPSSAMYEDTMVPETEVIFVDSAADQAVMEAVVEAEMLSVEAQVAEIDAQIAALEAAKLSLLSSVNSLSEAAPSAAARRAFMAASKDYDPSDIEEAQREYDHLTEYQRGLQRARERNQRETDRLLQEMQEIEKEESETAGLIATLLSIITLGAL